MACPCFKHSLRGCGTHSNKHPVSGQAIQFPFGDAKQVRNNSVDERSVQLAKHLGLLQRYALPMMEGVGKSFVSKCMI